MLLSSMIRRLETFGGYRQHADADCKSLSGRLGQTGLCILEAPPLRVRFRLEMERYGLIGSIQPDRTELTGSQPYPRRLSHLYF